MSKTYIFNLENDLYDPNSFEPSPIGSPNTLLITQFTPNINDYTILPIKERLGFINQLKLENYNIIIWTKRKRDHLKKINWKPIIYFVSQRRTVWLTSFFTLLDLAYVQ